MTSEVSPFDVYVKAHELKQGEQESLHGQVGACPFSMRVLITLEEKNLSYKTHFIDLHNKPAWLLEINPPKGSVPVIKDNDTGAYIVDSDTICDYLEHKTDIHPLGTVTDTPKPGANIWKLFIDFLQGKSASKEALQQELQQIEDVVSDSKDKAWFGGSEINSWDVALAPRLYLARVGCKTLKGWDFAEEQFANIKSYLHRWTGRQSWRNVASWDEESIESDLREKMEVKEE